MDDECVECNAMDDECEEMMSALRVMRAINAMR